MTEEIVKTDFYNANRNRSLFILMEMSMGTTKELV